MQKILGIILLVLAILVALAMIINNHVLWFTVDIVVIVICAGCGIYLLNKTN
jgi:hypothetical protein